MSLIHEALKRAEAHSRNEDYCPPPLEEQRPVPQPTLRRTRTNRNRARFASVLVGAFFCAAGTAWMLMSLAEKGHTPRTTLADPRTPPPAANAPPASEPAPTAAADPTEAAGPVRTVEKIVYVEPLLTRAEVALAVSRAQRRIEGAATRALGTFAATGRSAAALFAALEDARRQQEQIAREKAEAERLAQRQAEQQRLARQRAEAERLARERDEAQRRAREQAEAKRQAELAAARAAADAGDPQASGASVRVTSAQERSPAATEASAEPDESRWTLNGIVYSYDRTDAVINNKQCRQGDTIDGAKVIQIERTLVRLLYQGKVITLRM